MGSRIWAWTWILLTVSSLAGCLAGNDKSGNDTLLDPWRDPGTGAILHDALDAAIGEPVEVLHDHNDPSLHGGSFNMDFVSWSNLGITLGDNGFANFVLWDDPDGGESLALVAVDGDTEGGFVIVDVSDPRNLSVLGRYWIQGNGIQEVRITPNGEFAVMNVQEIPQPGALGDGDLEGDCSVCIHVVNIQDRTNPQRVSVWPVELLGTHNLDFEKYGNDLYLFYVGQPLGTPGVDVGNHVWIARFVQSGTDAQIFPVSRLAHDTSNDAGRSFPHDVLVDAHPTTNQKIAYVSHWQGGAITYDVTDPLNPKKLDVHADPAPSEVSNIHWFMQEPQERADGRVIAWSAPEIGELDSGSGVIRAYDVTNPADIIQIGTWQLPGEVTIPDRFIFSPHTAIADQARGLLAVSHYHAGLWILDASTPEEPRNLGYFMPQGDPNAPYTGPLWWKKPNFSPEGYGPNVYQARWKDDLLWVTDRGTGFYVLDYTGPVPGSVL